jgi:hypothetical protein
VGWELQDAGQFASAVTALQRAQRPCLLRKEAGHRHPTITTEDPGSGAVHQLYVGEIESSEAICSGHTKIERLGHVVVATPTPAASVKFLCETLGFRESDRIVFLYFLDLDGLTVEYSCGMEKFDEAEPRTPRQWPVEPLSVDTWGSRRDPVTGAHGHIVRLSSL